MKRAVKLTTCILLILTFLCNGLVYTGASARSYERKSLRVGLTDSVSKRFKKTTLIENRTVEIEYVISGLYVYDANTGKILSAYGASLDEVSLVKDPGGVNTSWDIECSDISVESDVSSDGTKATFSARFHVNLIRYEGYVPIVTYDLGYIQNSVSGTGS